MRILFGVIVFLSLAASLSLLNKKAVPEPVPIVNPTYVADMKSFAEALYARLFFDLEDIDHLEFSTVDSAVEPYIQELADHLRLIHQTRKSSSVAESTTEAKLSTHEGAPSESTVSFEAGYFNAVGPAAPRSCWYKSDFKCRALKLPSKYRRKRLDASRLIVVVEQPAQRHYRIYFSTSVRENRRGN